MLFAGIDGFLGTRASLMLDVVVVAMLVFLPLLVLSVSLSKYRRRYSAHKWAQLGLGAILLVTVSLFELDVRINGWRDRATASPYFGRDGALGWIDFALGVHLCFAVTTALLWVAVITMALRGFSSPPTPGPHSRRHKFWGQLAVADMFMTSVTGWVFYWMAFVAR